jgi:hypothetical protein
MRNVVLALGLVALLAGALLGWRAHFGNHRGLETAERAHERAHALEAEPFPALETLSRHAFEDTLPQEALPAGARCAIISLDPREPRVVWPKTPDADLERVARALRGESSWPELAKRNLANPPSELAVSWTVAQDEHVVRVLVLRARRSGARVVVALRSVEEAVE